MKPAIQQSRETALDFADRIEKAKNARERRQIRAEFNRWFKNDTTMSGIMAGIKKLLKP